MTEIQRLRRELKRRRRDLPRCITPQAVEWHKKEIARLEAELDAALRAEGHRPLPLEE